MQTKGSKMIISTWTCQTIPFSLQLRGTKDLFSETSFPYCLLCGPPPQATFIHPTYDFTQQMFNFPSWRTLPTEAFCRIIKEERQPRVPGIVTCMAPDFSHSFSATKLFSNSDWFDSFPEEPGFWALLPLLPLHFSGSFLFLVMAD